jgi:hypothetical protein
LSASLLAAESKTTSEAFVANVIKPMKQLVGGVVVVLSKGAGLVDTVDSAAPASCTAGVGNSTSCTIRFTPAAMNSPCRIVFNSEDFDGIAAAVRLESRGTLHS